MAERNTTLRRRNSMRISGLLRAPAVESRRASDSARLMCRPCLEAGRRREATNYCGQCHVYMCSACQWDHNTRTKRTHSLPLGKHHNEVRYDCVKHKSKAIQYFCISHNVLGCHDCVADCHKACGQVKSIPDLIQETDGVKIQEKFDELTETLNISLKHAAKNKAGLAEKKEKLAEKRTRAVAKVRQLRNDINKLFDIVESEVESQSQSFYDQDMNKVKEQSLEYDFMTTNIENLLAELRMKSSDEQSHELFVAMKTTETNIELIREKLAQLEADNLISNYDFVPDREVRRLLQGKASLGSIHKDREAAFVVDLKVKLSKDQATCWISGLVAVSEECVVIADHENASLKLVNTTNNKITAKFCPTSPPWGITMVEDRYIATTLPDKKQIVILDVKSKFKKVSVLQVEAECCGICYGDGKFYITCIDPAKVLILNVDGNILQTISADSTGNPLFSNPFHIALSPDLKYIYVSDVHEHSVTCLTVDGTFVNAYKSYSLTGPTGLAADGFGNVYVCGGWSNTVHRLRADCSEGTELLRNMADPQSITISRDQRKFFVGKLASNRIAVYEVD